ncbi:hypothetical protein [Pseudomonas phage PA5]|uniref:Uncharacterized protein n=1 Tax=Pseudomonas phage PA5 TaxID=1913570 RepID=A0A1J0MIG4_9CAUD|nr:hypothetical protein FDH19_gp016 [Pseudomonas phage PA5]APD20714.1 hypothetical protein [Pseudomonas phage PA5]
MATKADLELEVQQLRRVLKSREHEIEELHGRLERHRDIIRRVRLYLWSRLLIHRRTAETLEVGDSIAKTIAAKKAQGRERRSRHHSAFERLLRQLC